MGLSKAYLQFLIQEHKRSPFEEPILLMGRQYVYATLDEVKDLFRRENVMPAAINLHAIHSNVPAWKGMRFEHNLSDVGFFEMLGLKNVKATDVSAYEGADIVMDLNQPVPSEHLERFGLVLDSGTLEHVFDVRQAIANMAGMVKCGGRIIHFSPMNNFVNHGFYQFSPTFFFDYYRINEFENLRGWLSDLPRYGWNTYARDLFQLGFPQPGHLISSTMMETLFIARKTDLSTTNKIPIQAHYASVFAAEPPANGETSGLRGFFKQRLSPGAKQFLIHYVRVTYQDNRLPEWIKALLFRFVPGLDPQKKPWGLKKVGKLG